MPHYVLNKDEHPKKPMGYHEVHVKECFWFPKKFIDLGYHESCDTAVAQAQITDVLAVGCDTCCPDCHSG